MKSSSGMISKQPQILAIILVSYLMIVLDISIVITALPKMRQGLDFTTAGLSWVQNAYTLAFGGLLLLGARAGDIFGRRRMFILGLGIFTAASLAVGLAHSIPMLLVSRAIQGLGAAVLAPTTLALLSTNFAEGVERNRAVNYYAAIAGVGASLGLVLGGVFADWLSWRVGFFINLPIGLALILATRHYLSETEKRAGSADIAGGLSSTLGMTALVYGIVRSATTGWADFFTIRVLLAAGILLALFFLIEWRAPQPIMPLRLLADRQRAGAYLARMMFLGAMVGFWFFSTQLLQGVLNYSPSRAGVAFLATTVPNFAAAMFVPVLAKRFGNRKILAVGLIVSFIGMAWLSRVGVDTTFFDGVALPMILIGIGQGGALGPLTAAGVAGIRPEDAGAGSGLVNVAHQLGGSLGLGILVTVFANASTNVSGEKAKLAHGIATAFSAGSLMLALALIVVFVMIRPGRKNPTPETRYERTRNSL